MRSVFVLTLLPSLVFFSLIAQAQTESVIHSFTGQDGLRPEGGVIIDSAGNVFGTTSAGGANDQGNVFELSPPTQPGGAWTETSLYSFSQFPGDGIQPVGDLIRDSAGNLYGTTISGGNTGTNCVPYGCGTVFELSPPIQQGDPWTEKILYTFSGAADGSLPGGLLLRNGTLYGTTTSGGLNYGTVYALRQVNGAWIEHVIYRFKAGHDGCNPNQYDTLVADAAGNLFGTTQSCGPAFAGIVFEISPPTAPGGRWTESVLHTFGSPNDGQTPWAGLTFDSAGNLYGTSYGGGANGSGTVFEMSPPVQVGDPWTETVLYSFLGTNSQDGSSPAGPVLVDTSGNLYGTASTGPGFRREGIFFKLSPPAQTGDPWTETVLHHFGVGNDGAMPVGAIAHHGRGFIGVTFDGGGTGNYGTIYAVVQ